MGMKKSTLNQLSQVVLVVKDEQLMHQLLWTSFSSVGNLTGHWNTLPFSERHFSRPVYPLNAQCSLGSLNVQSGGTMCRHSASVETGMIYRSHSQIQIHVQ